MIPDSACAASSTLQASLVLQYNCFVPGVELCLFHSCASTAMHRDTVPRLLACAVFMHLTYV